MEEIIELKKLIKKHDYEGALKLAEELEEMGAKDIANNIRSYAVILLLHLIKRSLENRTTRSWDISISNSATEISLLNRRPKSKGNYLNHEDLKQAVEDAWKLAVNRASLQSLKGKLSPREIAASVDKDELVQQALDAIASSEESF